MNADELAAIRERHDRYTVDPLRPERMQLDRGALLGELDRARDILDAFLDEIDMARSLGMTCPSFGATDRAREFLAGSAQEKTR